jgi:hypothetical protein
MIAARFAGTGIDVTTLGPLGTLALPAGGVVVPPLPLPLPLLPLLPLPPGTGGGAGGGTIVVLLVDVVIPLLLMEADDASVQPGQSMPRI